jgi:hypothetical protein
MSIQHQYFTRSKGKTDQTLSELSTELPSTRRMTSSNVEHETTDTDESQHLDNNDSVNSNLHITQQAETLLSDKTCSLQEEMNHLRKELEFMKLKQSQQHATMSHLSDSHSFTHHPLSTHLPPSSHTPMLVSSPPLHFVINTDPLQQMKDFVKPFHGTDNDDVIKWIESIVHYFDIARLPGDKEKLYLQYAPAFLKEYAYKWWADNKHRISNWQTFTQLIIEQFGHKNEYFIEQQLDQRKQQADEPVIKYYYDIIDLCKKYDPKMSNKQKIHKLMNGLRLSLYQDAIKETYSTPSEFLTKVQHFENIQKLIDLRQMQMEVSTVWKDIDDTSTQKKNFHRSSKSQSSSNAPSSNRLSQATYNIAPSRNEYSNQSYHPQSFSPNYHPWQQQSDFDRTHRYRQSQPPQTRRIYDSQPITDYNRSFSSSQHGADLSNGSNFQCYNCGQSGHIARHCQQDNNAQHYTHSKNR